MSSGCDISGWCSECYLCGIVYTGVFFAITEKILENDINSLDPLKDFTPISPNCNVTGFIYEGSCQLKCGEDGKTKCGCKDKYSYIFSAPKLEEIDSYYIGRYNDGYQFKSEIGESNRDAKDCSSGGEEAIAAPLFTIGESVTCYRPSTPGQKVRQSYTCGNDDCIKIFDPQDDKDEPVSECSDGGMSLLEIVFYILGYFLLWVAIFIIKGIRGNTKELLCACFKKCCVNNENNSQVTTPNYNSGYRTVSNESIQTQTNVEMSILDFDS